MNRNQKKTRRRRQIVRLWTLEQAQSALPYIASIVRSLREHRLEAQQLDRTARRLAARPGRPDRQTLIAHEEAVREAEQAMARFHKAAHELQSLDVYCLDPIRGEALIPFLRENQLAWFLFDLFDTEPLQFWRFHSDPLDYRRPVADLQQEGTEVTQIV